MSCLEYPVAVTDLSLPLLVAPLENGGRGLVD
jgi:hypothetical protein